MFAFINSQRAPQPQQNGTSRNGIAMNKVILGTRFPAALPPGPASGSPPVQHCRAAAYALGLCPPFSPAYFIEFLFLFQGFVSNSNKTN